MYSIGKRFVFLFICILCVALVSCGDNGNNSLASMSEEISSSISEDSYSSEEIISQIISNESDQDLQSNKSNIETKEEDDNKFGEFC